MTAAVQGRVRVFGFLSPGRGLRLPAWPVWLIALALVAGCAPKREPEEAALLEAATAYMEAEMDGDAAKIWLMIAPSSVFKATHTYSTYVDLMTENRVRVKSFAVQQVMKIEVNQDRAAMPAVEKIAAVKIQVTLGGDAQPDALRTNVLTFLKENGKWYKG